MGQVEHGERPMARRAKIVLPAADGLNNEAIANQSGMGRIQAGRWRERFAAGRLGRCPSTRARRRSASSTKEPPDVMRALYERSVAGESISMEEYRQQEALAL